MPVILDSILRAGEGKMLRHLKRISEQINSVEDDFVAMSDAELRALPISCTLKARWPRVRFAASRTVANASGSRSSSVSPSA